VVADHSDTIRQQSAIGRVADVPIDDTPKSENAKAPAPFLAMQDAALLVGSVPALFPRTAKAREKVFGVFVWDAVAVVGHLDRFDSAERVIVKHYVDSIGIGIDGVPYQLGNSEERLVNLCKTLKVVVLDLNLESFRSQITTLSTSSRLISSRRRS
jgi:hypothetical protein